MNKPTNLILAIAALVLGGLAIFAGNPVRNHTVRFDVKEMAAMIEQEEDHRTPAELAEMIMQRKTGYRLVDLRDSVEYARYHIPTAECIPLSALFDGRLRRDETIVLYSEGGTHASQAWLLMRADGYKNAFTMKGGLQAWNDEILNPTITPKLGSTPASKSTASNLAAAGNDTEHVDIAAIISRAHYFGGMVDSSGISAAPSPTPQKHISQKRKALPSPANNLREDERIKQGC